MKSLHITLDILSTILAPKYPVHLDALLYAVLKDNSDMDDDTALKKLDQILDKADGIYKASAMRFLKTNHHPINAKPWSLATRTHWEDWEFSTKEKARNVTIKGGPYRKRVTTYNGIQCFAVDFYAVGDADKISHLLNCLGFIGLNNSQGFGEIGNISITEIDEDLTFVDEAGELARCLPVHMISSDMRKTVMQIQNSVKPPYKTSERMMTCIPNFRTKHIS